MLVSDDGRYRAATIANFRHLKGATSCSVPLRTFNPLLNPAMRATLDEVRRLTRGS